MYLKKILFLLLSITYGFCFLGGCDSSTQKPPKKDHLNLQSTSKKRGKVLIQKMACLACHKIGQRGGDNGPDLSHIGSQLIKEKGSFAKAKKWIILHLKEPQKYKGKNWRKYRSTKMPSYRNKLKPQEMEDIADYLLSLKDENHKVP